MIFEEYSDSKPYCLGSVVSVGADLYISVSLGQITGHAPSADSPFWKAVVCELSSRAKKKLKKAGV
jgi:hypothetical protein